MMHYDLVISVEVNLAFNLTSYIHLMYYGIIQVNFLRIICFYFCMNIKLFMFILGSFFIGHCFGLFTSANNVYQETREIFINDTHSFVTTEHVLKLFS